MKGRAAFYKQPFLSYRSFSRIICAVFLGKINKQIQEGFEQYFVTKQGFLASKKRKNKVFEDNGYTAYT